MRSVPVSHRRASVRSTGCGIERLENRSLLSGVGIFPAAGDVGSPARAGSDSAGSGSYTIKGSGTDIWGTADQFNFASTPLTGDGSIVARVAAVQNTDPWAKAGVMFRQTSAGNSTDAYVTLTPHAEVQFLDRPATGAAAVPAGDSFTAAGPLWVKEVRTGNSFTGYWGTDGVNWNQLGGPVSIAMGATVSVGLVVSSHNTGLINTSVFDHVSVTAAPSSGVYRLSTKGQPGMSLDVENWGNTSGTPISLYHANYTSNQQWLVESQGDGTYKIYAYQGANSLQMLDLANGTPVNGTSVRTWEDNNATAQRWVFKPVSGGYWEIQPLNGVNLGEALDITGGVRAGSGSRAEIYQFYGTANQEFSLVAPGPANILPSWKKGIAGYPNEAGAIHPSWAYDWGSGGANAVPAGVEYDPMVWGYYGNANNSFANWMSGIKNTGAKWVMGLNEPDNASQSNSTVANALEAWGYMQNAGLPLLSPAATDAGDAWMQSFMSGAAARGYRVDAVAIHWYGGNDPVGFINYVNYIHTLYNRPVWITEFAPADWSGNHGISSQQAYDFMNAVVPQLNQMGFVQRYSWFSGSTTDPALGQDALYNGDGSLTPLGRLYSRL